MLYYGMLNYDMFCYFHLAQVVRGLADLLDEIEDQGKQIRILSPSHLKAIQYHHALPFKS